MFSLMVSFSFRFSFSFFFCHFKQEAVLLNFTFPKTFKSTTHNLPHVLNYPSVLILYTEERLYIKNVWETGLRPKPTLSCLSLLLCEDFSFSVLLFLAFCSDLQEEQESCLLPLIVQAWSIINFVSVVHHILETFFFFLKLELRDGS